MYSSLHSPEQSSCFTHCPISSSRTVPFLQKHPDAQDAMQNGLGSLQVGGQGDPHFLYSVPCGQSGSFVNSTVDREK